MIIKTRLAETKLAETKPAIKKPAASKTAAKKLTAMIAAAAMTVTMAVPAFAGGEYAYTSGPEGQVQTRKVIIDTDTGADDASALIFAAKCPKIDILGVTVLAGNVDLEKATWNAEMAMELAGCETPVYKGSAENIRGERIEAFSVFGTDGMGDAGLIKPAANAPREDAIGFMLETIRQNPGEIEIIALGPATNIARAIQRDPETMKQVKMIWSMGTAGLGPGNASPVAEFNVYEDPEAYKIMLDSGIPITIVGLDMCGGAAQWTDAQFEELAKSGTIGQFVTASFGKLREFYAANGSGGLVMNCDALSMFCALYPDFVRDTAQYHCSCITAPGETRGEVLFYRQGFTYDAVQNDFVYNVTLVTDVDKENYFNRYLNAVR